MQTKRLNRVCFITATPEQKTQHQALIAAPVIRICAAGHRQNVGPRMTPSDRHDVETHPDCVSAANARCGSVWPLDRLDIAKKEPGASPQGFVVRTLLRQSSRDLPQPPNLKRRMIRSEFIDQARTGAKPLEQVLKDQNPSCDRASVLGSELINFSGPTIRS
jgi:hypothetical protein